MKSIFLVTLLTISNLQAEVRGWWDIAPREYPELAINFTQLPEKDNGLLKLTEITQNLEEDKHIAPTNQSKDSEWEDLRLLYKLGKPIDSNRLQSFLVRHAAQLKLIRKIALNDKLQHPENPAATVNFHAIMEVMQVVELLKLEHHYHLKHGNIDEAIDSINTFQKLNRKLTQIDGSAVCFLVICALNKEATELILKSLKHPSLSDSHLNSIRSNFIAPSEFDKLVATSLRYEFQFTRQNIEILSAGGPKQEELFNQIFSFENDLSEIFETTKSRSFEQYIQSRLYKVTLSVGLQPNKTIKGFAQSYRALIHDLSHASFDTKKMALSEPQTKDLSNLVGELFLARGADPISRVYYKNVSENKINQVFLKTLLALRAYQLKNGDLPVRLDPLTPEYLANLPIDHYSGKPLLYSKERKLLWSIGYDLKDNKGASKESLEEAKIAARKKLQPKKKAKREVNKPDHTDAPYNKYRKSPDYIRHSQHLEDSDEPHIAIPF